MVLHFNRSRLYKGTVGVGHGVLVELLRHTRHFWKAYKEMLEINGNLKIEEKQLHKVMKQLKLVPEENEVPKKKKKKDKILEDIRQDFQAGLEELKKMFKNLDGLLIDDETLLYRAMEELEEIYAAVWKLEHLPEHRRAEILNHMYSLMHHISTLQRQTWTGAKAHARGFRFTQVGEMSVVRSRKIWWRMKKQTIELDHILNLIEPLQRWVVELRHINQEHIEKVQKRIVKLIKLYHQEITDLHHILHEAHIFTRRTELLFSEIKREAHTLGDKDLKKSVDEYSKMFHKIHKQFLEQAKREALDISIILKRQKRPPEHHARHHAKAA
jgi:hypothetical protein